ncbi:MAG TPA: CehA/McbA family metallohydrolase [Pyrinomonadaceae bacterium]|nr:CehA/McbA family metallohydrolase [Pyrinomonadaceae bacterium]
MRRRKILIVMLGLVVLSQLPFVYRRYRLARLQKAIQQLESLRAAPQGESDFVDYQGVIHVHSSLGGHSTGTFAELIAAAKANQLDFVIMTEHPQTEFDTSAMTLSGVHAGIVFINGNEVATASGDRLLLIPGNSGATSASSQSTAEIVDQQKSSGGLAFVAYPEESGNWRSTRVDGVEAYNLFTNARQYNAFVAVFDSLWSYHGSADLMFSNFFARPAANLKRWDEALSVGNRRLVAIAGNDAHSNIGLSVNDASGKQWLGVKLDPYERSFRVVRTHVLIRKDIGLTRESLLEAISRGHCYVSFDLFSNGRGFSFAAVGTEQKIMGDEIAFADGLRLTASAPLAARFVLFKDGSVIDQESGSKAEFSINSRGVYRVEVYLDSLPAPAKGEPWILSNPIYIK